MMVLFWARTLPQESRTYPELGKPAPKLEIAEWIQGKPAGEAPLSGKTLILEFWATWCAPCRMAIPHMNEIADRFRDSGVVVVSMTDEGKGVIQKFVSTTRMTSAVVLDREASDEHVTQRAYGVTSIPHAFLIDNAGILRWHGHPKDIGAGWLGKYLRTGEVPKTSEPEGRGMIASVTANALYHLDIDRSPTASAQGLARGGGMSLRHWEDTLEIVYRQQTLVSIISALTGRQKTRIKTEGDMPDDLLNITIRATAPMSDSLARWRCVECLSDMYGITVSRATEPGRVLRLLCKNPGLLKISGGSGFSSSSDPTTWMSSGMTFRRLSEGLESIFDSLVVDESGQQGGYDFEIPIENFTETRSALEKKYGILLEAAVRDVEFTILKFHKPEGKK
jgi:thiol-disulfide isomerase/thioredoxin